MKEYIEKIEEWSAVGNPVAVARVTKTWGSSPRPVGAMMIINKEGLISGSVSGGCVESAVVKRSKKILDDQSAGRISFGVSDEEAWQVGLSCGGSIQVFVQSADFNSEGIWLELKKAIENNQSAILVSSLEDGSNTNSLLLENDQLLGDAISDELRAKAKKAYNQRTSLIVDHNEKQYFIQVFPRRSQLIIVGVAHITVDLVTLGKMYGFETIVIDPRGYFVDNTSFNDPPDQLINAYPSDVLNDFPLDPYTYCAILSHDPKIDDNALEILLHKDLGYLGALGSRKTHTKRTNRLLEKGLSRDLIDKVRAPIGVPIKAKSAREIALSIISEIVEAKNHYL
jgi:xanthine dehydrogenase accessory factor